MVIGLVGTLGAGKTRLVRALAEALGVDPGAIASPTFVLIHEYQGRLPIYHFDAYRLADPDEFDALGASDHWLEGDRLCLIEWADLVADRLPGFGLVGPDRTRRPDRGSNGPDRSGWPNSDRLGRRWLGRCFNVHFGPRVEERHLDTRRSSGR